MSEAVIGNIFYRNKVKNLNVLPIGHHVSGDFHSMFAQFCQFYSALIVLAGNRDGHTVVNAARPNSPGESRGSERDMRGPPIIALLGIAILVGHPSFRISTVVPTTAEQPAA